MVSAGVNYLAVLIAGVAYFIMGAIWYQHWLFGNLWLKGVGKTKEQADADFKASKLVWVLIVSLITAYGIARIISYTGATTLYDAIMLSALAAICLVITNVSLNNTMEARPCKLTLVNGLFNLVGFVIMGAIIGYWR
jgi:hypothetical protein